MLEHFDNQKRISVLFLVFAALTLVMVSLSFARGVTIMMHYVCPLAFAFAGMTLFSGRYRRQIDLWAGVSFVCWYVLSRILLKELYLDYSFSMFSNLCCAYLLAFPFARSMNDGQKKSGLKAVAWVFVIGYGLIAWIGVFAALYGQNIVLPVLGTEVKTGWYDLRLYAGNHPNISACMFLVALMLGIWLIGQTKCRVFALLLLMCVLGAYLGITLTVSRTVMIQVSCFAAGCIFLALLRLPLKKTWIKMAIALAAAAVCLVLVFVSFNWTAEGINHFTNEIRAYAEQTEPVAVRQRDLLSDLATMTGRTTHYQGILRLLREQPDIILTGVLNSEIVPLLLEYAGAEHAHNSYLQTLVNMGLLGLVIAVFFTVRAVWVSIKLVFNKKATYGNQMLAVILLTFLVSTIPESYLFTEYLTIANMPFFLVFGYALEAERALRE